MLMFTFFRPLKVTGVGFLEKPSEVGGAGCYSPILNDENSLCFQNTMTPSSTKEVVGVEHRGLESKGSNNQKNKNMAVWWIIFLAEEK